MIVYIKWQWSGHKNCLLKQLCSKHCDQWHKAQLEASALGVYLGDLYQDQNDLDINDLDSTTECILRISIWHNTGRSGWYISWLCCHSEEPHQAKVKSVLSFIRKSITNRSACLAKTVWTSRTSAGLPGTRQTPTYWSREPENSWMNFSIFHRKRCWDLYCSAWRREASKQRVLVKSINIG